MGGLAAELGLDPVVRRRRQHDLADRGRMVQDVAERAAQHRRVERRRPAQAVFLGHREEELHADGRGRRRPSAGRREQHGHRRLVVGAEDAGIRVLPAPVAQDRLDRGGERDRVEMGAEHDARRPGSCRLDAGEEVPGVRAGRGGAAVLGRHEAHRPQLRGDPVRAGALAAGRALDPAQGGKGRPQPAAFLLGGPAHRAAAVTRPPAARRRLRPARPTARPPAPVLPRAPGRPGRTPGTAARGVRAAT